jgi:hypothetical protein
MCRKCRKKSMAEGFFRKYAPIGALDLSHPTPAGG